jgi:hypothetical protein
VSDTASTATSFDSSGSTATDALIDSNDRNSFSLARSESVVLPNEKPSFGKTDTFGTPSILSVRWRSSFILRSSRFLTNVPSTIKSAATTASTTSSTIPPAP